MEPHWLRRKAFWRGGDGSAHPDTCCQGWQPEVHLQDPEDVLWKEKPTPQSCPLMANCPLHKWPGWWPITSFDENRRNLPCQARQSHLETRTRSCFITSRGSITRKCKETQLTGGRPSSSQRPCLSHRCCGATLPSLLNF